MLSCRRAGLVVALLLAAARPGVAQPLVLWHAYRAAEREALEETVRSWNERGRRTCKAGCGRGFKEDPPLKLLAVPYDAFMDKVTAAIPRGHGPDLFIFSNDRIGDWAESRIIEPIEFWMTEQHADQFFFKVIDALCYRDSLYGLPLAFKSTVLFYNKALVPRPPRTTDELIALGKKLTDARAGRFGLVYWNTLLYFHAPWHFGFGGQIFDEKGKLRVRTPAAERALAFARDLGGPGGIMPAEVSATLVTALFNQGKAAMAISGPWMMGELSPTLPVGIAPLPRISATGKPAGPFLGAEAVMMSAKSPRKAAAFRAMTYLTDEPAALVRARKARQPVAHVAVWTDPQVKSDPILRVFREQLDTTVVMPSTPEMRLVWSPFDMMLQRVISGQASPATALREAEREITSYLAAARRKPR